MASKDQKKEELQRVNDTLYKIQLENPQFVVNKSMPFYDKVREIVMNYLKQRKIDLEDQLNIKKA